MRTWRLSAAVAIVMVGGWIAAAQLGSVPPLRTAHSEPAILVPSHPVIVTASGKIFHRAGCSFIHGPAERKSGVQAVADGYTPCLRCLAR